MPSYVAFLRAVNVGGRFVRMAGLRAALVEAGFTDVETHIQSGNVFVRSARRSTASVAAELSRVTAAFAGFDVPAVVRTPAQLREALRVADGIPPMLDGELRRYLALADGPVPVAAAATLEAWDRPGERVRVLGWEVLADMTSGFHRTTLTPPRLERLTGLTTPWRDRSVVRAVDERWGA